MNRTMQLFRVKDTDGFMWVVSANWRSALEGYRHKIREENALSVDEPIEPLGIEHVCDADELVLPPGEDLARDMIRRLTAKVRMVAQFHDDLEGAPDGAVSAWDSMALLLDEADGLLAAGAEAEPPREGT